MRIEQGVRPQTLFEWMTHPKYWDEEMPDLECELRHDTLQVTQMMVGQFVLHLPHAVIDTKDLNVCNLSWFVDNGFT